MNFVFRQRYFKISRQCKLRSLLIVIKEEYLSKGIALALMDYFQSIHNTKNPYEAIEILKKEKIDIIISGVDFKTIEPDDYVESVINHTKQAAAIIIINDASFSMNESSTEANIILQQKPISIPNIINLIKSLKENTFLSHNGD